MGRARDDQTKGIQTIDENHALVWRQVWNGMIRWGVLKQLTSSRTSWRGWRWDKSDQMSLKKIG